MIAPQGLEIEESFCENMRKPATSFPSHDPIYLINERYFLFTSVDILLFFYASLLMDDTLSS